MKKSSPARKLTNTGNINHIGEIGLKHVLVKIFQQQD
nr:MAG TPA: hypothetical protein [Caudoviricetes sp.]